MAPIFHWLAGVGAAISIKLSSSIDDVVWLAPFLTTNVSVAGRTKNTVIYIGVCLVQTVLAMCIAYSGDKMVSFLTKNAKDAWSSDKILTVAAGTMLAVYSIKLIKEYIDEMNEEDDDDTKEDAGDEHKYNKVDNSDTEAAKPSIEMVPSRQGSRELSARNRNIDSANEDAAQEKEESQSKTLFFIAFIGSLDDLTLFVPMLVGKGFDLAQLVVGGFMAASLIVTICLFVGLCKPVADLLAKIPLFAIVIAFAVMLLIKAFNMD